MRTEDRVEIGRTVRLQVQSASLKIGCGGEARYDPSPLRAVPRLRLTADGALGLTAEGQKIMDIHHAWHPESRHHGGNSLSVGFTDHYRHMRAEFGPRLTDGIAGENILVETDRSWSLDDLGSALFLGPGAERLGAVLTGIHVAAPCAPFSRFALGDRAAPPTLRAAVQFLHHGRRGFYVTLTGPDVATIEVGDRVYHVRPDAVSRAWPRANAGRTGAG